MSKVYMDGLLFFEGGRELHIVAYDVMELTPLDRTRGWFE